MTPWGRAASDYAAELFTAGRTVTLEFEGNEPVAECLQRYRDNFGGCSFWSTSMDSTSPST